MLSFRIIKDSCGFGHSTIIVPHLTPYCKADIISAPQRALIIQKFFGMNGPFSCNFVPRRATCFVYKVIKTLIYRLSEDLLNPLALELDI